MRSLPKASLGAMPMFLSIEFGLSMVMGYFAALFIAGKKTGDRGRFPSWAFTVKDYRIHLHHWFLSLLVLVGALVANVFLTESWIFFGFIGGVIFQGVLHYEDWPRLITKQK